VRKCCTPLRFGDSERVANAISTLDAADRERPALHLVLGSLRLVQSEPASASRALSTLLGALNPSVTAVSSIRALLLEAIERDALGDRSESERCLEDALDLAETEGVLGRSSSRVTWRLLERHVERRTAHAHLVRQVLDMLGGSRRTRSYRGGGSRAGPRPACAVGQTIGECGLAASGGRAFTRILRASRSGRDCGLSPRVHAPIESH
jgi:hypothetical protein